MTLSALYREPRKQNYGLGLEDYNVKACHVGTFCVEITF